VTYWNATILKSTLIYWQATCIIDENYNGTISYRINALSSSEGQTLANVIAEYASMKEMSDLTKTALYSIN